MIVTMNLFVKLGENVKYNDFWKFDLEKKRWEEIVVGDPET